jgi:hypothetical protein
LPTGSRNEVDGSQTAILREILSCEKYHVLHLDLRLAGIADIQSLYTSLNLQMEQYFMELANMVGGYKVFEAEARRLKVSPICSLVSLHAFTNWMGLE